MAELHLTVSGFFSVVWERIKEASSGTRRQPLKNPSWGLNVSHTSHLKERESLVSSPVSFYPRVSGSHFIIKGKYAEKKTGPGKKLDVLAAENLEESDEIASWLLS